jgi:hypothetical protein
LFTAAIAKFALSLSLMISLTSFEVLQTYPSVSVPEKRVRPNASVLVLVAVAAAAILSPMLLFPASGQEGQGTSRTDPGQPDDPDCWGRGILNSCTERYDDQPGLGEHASDPIPDGEGDNDTPRAGVGNQAEDTPPEHGANVGQIVGGCQPDRNDP